MNRDGKSGLGSRLAGVIAGSALLVAIPSAGLALGLIDDGEASSIGRSFVPFTPANADPRVAELIDAHGGSARMMRFTPAGRSADDDRAITVAVRIDDEAAKAITVRTAIAAAREPVAADAGPRIAPTRYNLGLARGYRSFAKPPAPAISESLSTATIPDLSQFEPSEGVQEKPSRFAARIALEEEAGLGSAPSRNIDVVGDQALDVAGSYRLTRNLDVRAGVRYEQDRNRMTALPNLEQQDSQAVYIGTQFRF